MIGSFCALEYVNTTFVLIIKLLFTGIDQNILCWSMSDIHVAHITPHVIWDKKMQLALSAFIKLIY
jgi:hypothetical protein